MKNIYQNYLDVILDKAYDSLLILMTMLLICQLKGNFMCLSELSANIKYPSN